MKKFKMLLSVMALGVLLITNVVPVSAAEKIQSTKIESLSELDLDTYTQELMEADDGIQLYAPAPALTQFKLLLINSEKAGQETIQNSSSSMQVGSRLDHGGTWFQAITAEVGYAKTRYAYFNSSCSPNSTQTQSVSSSSLTSASPQSGHTVIPSRYSFLHFGHHAIC